ncbi:putative 2-octaprenyl-3-methyl-6-methoxy-1, 4-benzoquinol hydroxylase [Nitrospira sp. KM1]|uniref:FAD-dependent oxidoreductase n=1 Tax=Nitrospira sp. KM1 TaxID=1936990 RepID=UPI0013A71E41|nr:NAD(P)/FAD-dependent oxidoreductase [Nitrospira sp. KM1]BCA53291.1 putative 2-octaprenyl-3-methyl-6-methoxy-1, 4-benzoquinol hydroxylase [Nitrospira sp. KM1]
MIGAIETDVAVVGAGGGGAVLALALAQKGIRTIVLDQVPGPPQGLRGEILQPNGQRILDRLGVLHSLPADATRTVRLFNFCRAGGKRLCTIDYGDLPEPYNRAVVTLPNVAHHAIVKAIEQQPAARWQYATSFTGLIREGRRIIGLTANGPEGAHTIRAQVVVGADGAFSNVREAMGISTDIHLYPQAYLIAIVDAPNPLNESFYYVGHHQILGLFPATGSKAYLFYMIRNGSMDAIKQRGIARLQKEWTAIAPQFEPLFANLQDWNQTAYMPTGRVRTPTWVADGAVIIGDAAHAMNPHASQGRMQAMVDAMTLADLLPACLTDHDCTANRLRGFETARRPHVTMLQHLADQQVFYWNTGNPIVAFLRDRVFRTLDRNSRLRHQVLSTTAGLRTTAPFSLLDRVIAAGFLPDVRAGRAPQQQYS